MDDAKIRILIAIITAIISGAGVFFSRESKVESLSRESEQRYARIVSLEREKIDLQTQFNNLEYNYSELQNSYNILYSKYQKCISSSGANYQIGSFDFDRNYQKEFSSNDVLEFEMMSASLFIQIIRISKLGPVINIGGCEYYMPENGINSTNDGKHAFYLSTSNPFRIYFSSKSCIEGNATIPEEDIEFIEITVISFDVDEQKTILQYKRALNKR